MYNSHIEHVEEKITLHCWWLSARGKDRCENSHLSPCACYLKVPPAFFIGDPLPSDRYWAQGESKASFQFICCGWKWMIDFWAAVTPLRSTIKDKRHLRWRKIITLLVYSSLSCFSSLSFERDGSICKRGRGYAYVFMHVKWGCDSIFIISSTSSDKDHTLESKTRLLQVQEHKSANTGTSGWMKVKQHHRSSFKMLSSISNLPSFCDEEIQNVINKRWNT